MFAAPAEGTLKHFMEFAETGFADHEQAPPHQRTHAAEHYAKLIDRKGRYGSLVVSRVANLCRSGSNPPLDPGLSTPWKRPTAVGDRRLGSSDSIWQKIGPW